MDLVRSLLRCCVLGCAVILPMLAFAQDRTVISLNGIWDLAEGGLEGIPKDYPYKVPVPGLVDLATPQLAKLKRPEQQHFANWDSLSKVPSNQKPTPEEFAKDVAKYVAGQKPQQFSPAYWYRKNFVIAGKIPPVATLKIGKAKYETQVFVNGVEAGIHHPNFTPAYFEISRLLRGGGAENVISVRVLQSVFTPIDEISGRDNEINSYPPGIYDDVSLTLSNNPIIENVKTATDVKTGTVHVRASLRSYGPAVSSGAVLEIREAKTKTLKASLTVPPMTIEANGTKTFDAHIKVPEARFWSPEDPFLYDLQIRTSGDSSVTRFGMRTFRYDPERKFFVLNEKPIFLVGTNVALHRFFADPLRKLQPWEEAWIRSMIRKFKTDMHWNSFRFHIGAAPDIWYQICDEEGILVQDEWDIWGWMNRWNGNISTEKAVISFTEWLHANANHPSIVIWDTMNEAGYANVKKAIEIVRPIDIQNLPWEPGDINEVHPYGFPAKPDYRISSLDPKSVSTGSVIVNEYLLYWLRRDGSYGGFGGDYSKVHLRGVPETVVGEERVRYRRWLGAMLKSALTEFFRAQRHRGVMEFNSLVNGTDGTTGDHWLDVDKLAWDPYFLNFCRDSFAPVGLGIFGFLEDQTKGAQSPVKITAFNDRDKPWTGTITVRVRKGMKEISNVKAASVTIPPLDRAQTSATVTIPTQPGAYLVEASLTDGADTISSLRQFWVDDPLNTPEPLPVE
jgi:beta-galactosidase